MELIKTIDLATVESVLRHPIFREDIAHNLQAWREDYSVTDQDFKETKTWVEKLINDFLELLRDVEVDSELSVTIFTKYIELKCFWKLLNSQIQYQNFKTGSANTVLIGKASLTTFVLIAIEPLINEAELVEIQEFLTRPIQEVIRIESSIDITQEVDEISLMEAQLDSLYADKEYLQKHIGFTTADEIVESMENLEAQIRDLKEEFEDSVLLGNKISFIGKRKITIQKRK
jgi:glutaredoxin-related protein